MAAELITIIGRWEIWSTSKGYFIKDNMDSIPVFYSINYADIENFIKYNKNR